MKLLFLLSNHVNIHYDLEMNQVDGDTETNKHNLFPLLLVYHHASLKVTAFVGLIFYRGKSVRKLMKQEIEKGEQKL